MTWFSVDVEANGPVPGLYSMTSIGVVAVRGDLDETFYVELQPLPDAASIDEALAVGGMSLESLDEHGTEPVVAMAALADWLMATSTNRPVLVSDNPGFDASFVSYYFALFGIDNPFGHSARRIGDLYSGLKGDWRQGSAWKDLRTTTHTHNALDDAIGNAEALRNIAAMGLAIPED